MDQTGLVVQLNRENEHLLAAYYVVIRLDVAAKTGAGHCNANRLMMHKVHGTEIC